MRIAKVVGNVTLNRHHASLDGARLKLAIPMSGEELAGREPPRGETLVVYDELGAGDAALIGVSEGPEAAQPFRPEIKPVDAYVAAILDHVDVTGHGSRS